MTPAAPADLDELSKLMAMAFQSDPPMQAAMGTTDPAVMVERGPWLFRGLLNGGAIQAGTVDTIREGQQIIGAAAWYAPGHHGPTIPGLVTHARDFHRALGTGGMVRALKIEAEMAKYRPTTPHWYLHAIGVHPDARGQGVGAVLLDHRLNQADRAGQPAYLESSTARSGNLYRRHGFQPMRRIQLNERAAPYSMWRPAAQ
ncbi:N-acetyltransferase [Kocuria soli]|uniref:N-acetyltransferase n=1 Tax=Kocuria soli TaxID=2485125 RepID=A0A3N3ZMH5_9MICC|nr:GNAT family N-acetyltransferase [Kocuria soli]ROZ61872.1 N-acetyltransferase [Kocuria soli]